MSLNLQESYLLSHASVNDNSVFGQMMSYLLDEGYADSPAGAKTLIQGMSNEWKNHIITESGLGKAGEKGDADIVVGVKNDKAIKGGWTGTPQTGLGRNYKGDKDEAKKKADAQYKKDRKAAALDRRANGEDYVSKGINKIRNELG